MITNLHPEREPLLNLREAAEWLRVSSRKVWQLTRDGSLPAIRIGRALRFSPADLEALTEKLKGPVAPEVPRFSPWAALGISSTTGQKG